MERNSARLLALLRADGWVDVRQRGSHCTLKKPGVVELITVPLPEKDLPKGLVRRIYTIAGWQVQGS